ncbi:AraC family transcriptional regulator [Leptolyngbya sp. ST-U4]|uniref:AraC family transcriptional regulator n=1 Tax=Leptolyngbya sp. ST-U4 TaxID=2933912 RepID=UPI00329796F2
MSLLQEFLFDPTDRKIPLDQPPLENLPQWGHWIETPEYMVAIVPPGHLEVNLCSPLNLVATSFGLTQGVAAFDSARLKPYKATPGGFDIVPQGSTYRSVEDASCFVVFGYSQAFLSHSVAEGETVELLPGQIFKTHWGLSAAIAIQEFFDNGQLGGAFYLESVVTAVLGQIIYQRSTLSQRFKRPPEFLEPQLLKNVLDYIRANVSQSLNLSDIATIIGLSPYHFARAFKATTGIPPYQYVLQCRVELAQQLLQDKRQSLAEVAIEAGFGNQSHMTTVFRHVLQTTPKQYREEKGLPGNCISIG